MVSVELLEPCKHGFAHCLFVGGMVPNNRLLLLPLLKKKKQNKYSINLVKNEIFDISLY